MLVLPLADYGNAGLKTLPNGALLCLGQIRVVIPDENPYKIPRMKVLCLLSNPIQVKDAVAKRAERRMPASSTSCE